MEVRITLDQSEPPIGRLTVTSGAQEPGQAEPSVPFTGWLGLLRALSDAIGSSSDAGPGS
jgi:hypothetical protein